MPCCLLCTLRISPLTYEFEHMHESQAMATESRTPMMEGAIGKEGARHDVLPLLHLHRVTISSLSYTSRSEGERERDGAEDPMEAEELDPTSRGTPGCRWTG
jgi:hypothetical protein